MGGGLLWRGAGDPGWAVRSRRAVRPSAVGCGAGGASDIWPTVRTGTLHVCAVIIEDDSPLSPPQWLKKRMICHVSVD